MNTSGSKTLIYFITFHAKYDYGVDYQSCGSLHNIVTPLKHFYCIAVIGNKYMLTFASYNQLQMCGFSNVVNLLNSSPGIALC